MRKLLAIFLVSVALFAACKPKTFQPRPTIPLVESIVSDTTGLSGIVAAAGSGGANGSIAMFGEPQEVLSLSRLFQAIDAKDNIDGRAVRDSLPDFAGEHIDAIMDAWNAPYRHFQEPDSLREASVRGALFAWDSTCLKNTSDVADRLLKSRAKILVLTSPLASTYGRFDIDTLQQLCGGQCAVFSPVEFTLSDAVSTGARNVAVWAGREVRSSKAYENAAALMEPAPYIMSITPDAALDIRTSFRSLLRQYRASGRSLDAVILAEYGIDTRPLLSEIDLIRREGTEEDLAFSRMLSDDFVIVDPGESLAAAVYYYLRKENLFTHNIARPSLRYYETVESADAEPDIMEVGASYVQRRYVQDFN